MFRRSMVILICGFILSSILSGCVVGGGKGEDPEFQFTAGKNSRIAITGTLKDDTECRWLFGTKIGASKAELWLKLSVEDSNQFWLYPLNIGMVSGSNEFKIITPFRYKEKKGQELVVELLDDDGLTEEEDRLLKEAARVVGMLLCDGTRVYTEKIGIRDETMEAAVEVLEKVPSVLIKNMKKFDSYGSRKVNIFYTPDRLAVANPVTIIDRNSGRARCDLYFHLVPEPKEKK